MRENRNNHKVAKVDQLSTDVLRSFVQNELCAIHVPLYCDPYLCRQLGEWFAYNPELENYTHEIRNDDGVKYLEYGVERLGVPFNSTYGKKLDSPEKTLYYELASKGIRRVREKYAPHLSPIDKLRLELDELWPHGANVAAFEGRKMFVGIGRVMRAETSNIAEFQPHFDAVPQALANLQAQYAANIYLVMPEQGGELELWDAPPLSLDQLENEHVDHDWRSELPSSFLVAPRHGDLIIFNARRPHAIRSFPDGCRVTLQSFLGLTESQSIVFWN
jgi:hypothetical protein